MKAFRRAAQGRRAPHVSPSSHPQLPLEPRHVLSTGVCSTVEGKGHGRPTCCVALEATSCANGRASPSREVERRRPPGPVRVAAKAVRAHWGGT